MPELTYRTRFEDIENKDMQTVTVRLKSSDAATAGNYGAFFIATRPYEVMEVHAVSTQSGKRVAL